MQTQAPFEQTLLRKHPEPIAMVIVKIGAGKYNPMPLGWTMVTSREPALLAMSLGQTRYTLEQVMATREFVIAFPPSTMGKEMLYYGTNSGREVDKFTEMPVRTEPAAQIDCVLLADAVANFECRVVSTLPTGDHVIVVGEVIASHVNQDASVRRLYSIAQGESSGVVPG